MQWLQPNTVSEWRPDSSPGACALPRGRWTGRGGGNREPAVCPALPPLYREYYQSSELLFIIFSNGTRGPHPWGNQSMIVWGEGDDKKDRNKGKLRWKLRNQEDATEMKSMEENIGEKPQVGTVEVNNNFALKKVNQFKGTVSPDQISPENGPIGLGGDMKLRTF